MNVIEVRKIKEAIDLLEGSVEDKTENIKKIEKAKYILENLIEFKDFTLAEGSFK